MREEGDRFCVLHFVELHLWNNANLRSSWIKAVNGLWENLSMKELPLLHGLKYHSYHECFFADYIFMDWESSALKLPDHPEDYVLIKLNYRVTKLC